MGKWHTDWSAAKKKVKKTDLKAIFKKDLGGELDKLDKTLVKFNAEIDSTAEAGGGRLTQKQRDDFFKLTHQHFAKAYQIIDEYGGKLMKVMADIKKEHSSAKDKKEQEKLKTKSTELQQLYSDLLRGIRKSLGTAEGVIVDKINELLNA